MSSSFHKHSTGADLHAPARFNTSNLTGSSIGKLICVKFTGVDSMNRPTISICGASEVPNGITETIIDDTKTGFICSNGLLINADTSSWSDGATLYVGVSGVLTNISNGNKIAKVMKSDPIHGVLLVSIATIISTGGGGGGSGNGYFPTGW